MNISAFSFENFVRVKNKFVPLLQYDRNLPDEDYIEGKIELEVGGLRILSEEHWDLIDQLWAYLIDGASGILFEDQDMERFFPDQPLRLSFKRLHNKKLEIIVGSHVNRVDRLCFITAVANGGKSFFNKMLQIAPSGKSTWLTYIDKSEKLLATIECDERAT